MRKRILQLVVMVTTVSIISTSWQMICGFLVGVLFAGVIYILAD